MFLNKEKDFGFRLKNGFIEAILVCLNVLSSIMYLLSLIAIMVLIVRYIFTESFIILGLVCVSFVMAIVFGEIEYLTIKTLADKF